MRLPAINHEQKRHEASRQWCEELYQAFQDGRRLAVPITRETAWRTQNRISANTRQFWSTRGFRIRTSSDTMKTILSVWLEQKIAKAA